MTSVMRVNSNLSVPGLLSLAGVSRRRSGMVIMEGTIRYSCSCLNVDSALLIGSRVRESNPR